MRLVLACVAGLALVLSGCSKLGGSQSKAAIQAAIERHLQQRPKVMLNNMTLEVQDVKFSGDKAEAEVKFRSKQAPSLAVEVRYGLRKVGDQWEVESSSPSSGTGGNPNGDAGGAAPTPRPTEPALQPSH